MKIQPSEHLAEHIREIRELLELYVVCSKSELTEDAINRIRNPLISTLKPILKDDYE